MSTLDKLQEALDNKTLNTDKLSNEQKIIIDELIRQKKLKGPTTRELSNLRGAARRKAAREKEFLQDPLRTTGAGQPTYELVGDIGGSIFPYA